MTIAKTTSQVSYAGDGVTVAFPVGYRFIDDPDLSVYVVTDATGVAVLQTITTHYSVTNTGTEAGGTLTMVTAPASGETLLIQRDTPETQPADYTANDPFPAETHEGALDRLTLMRQDAARGGGRHVSFPTGDTTSPVLPPSPTRAGKLFGFDTLGVPAMYDASYPLSASFATRAEAVANLPTLADGAVMAAAGLFYEAQSGATDISDMAGFVPLGDVYPDHFAENTTPGTTDMGAAIQSAVDYVRIEKDGGDVHLLPTGYATSTTIEVWERVTIVGPTGMAVNWYTTDFAPKGAHIILLSGSNVDVVNIVISGNTTGSPVPAETNDDRRHGGGIVNVLIDGNKDDNPNPGNTGNNTAGMGVRLIGVNVVTMHDLTVLRCAEDGVKAESNGDPDGQCNNLQIHRVYSANNEESGYDLAGGDSRLSFLWASNNGSTGFTSSMGRSSYTSCYATDNSTHGFYSGADKTQFLGCWAYHNRSNGFLIDAEYQALSVCVAQHNGMNTGLAATSRCGFSLTANADHYSVIGCRSVDDGLGTPLVYTQEYGFYLINTGLTGAFEGNYADNNQTSDYSIASNSAVSLHQGVSASASHPGFTATGSIDMGGNLITGVNGLSFDAPRTVTSVTSNVLSIGADSLVTMNVSGGATVNSISSSASHDNMIVMVRNIEANAVTFTNGANLRTQSGSNLSLAQYAAATFAEFSDGVWYQVG